jgi:hypothetical protein
MRPRLLLSVVPAMVAVYTPTCVPPVVLPSGAPGDTRIEELWREPTDLSDRDLLYGPWGPERSPDPAATYTFIETKKGGVNPGMTVRDALGREWKVKQPPMDGRGAEGPIEVVLSRVLSAVGYHQPPVYYLPSFVLEDGNRTYRTVGGRFRLKDRTLKDVGEWSWQHNPFVGTKPYQGLLVILAMFNSSDLKNSNNTLYEHRTSQGVERWYVVRDLGTALGSTGRFAPVRGNAEVFARLGFIEGVERGFVRFDYHGWHQELLRERITPSDARWAAALLGRLTLDQWHEAFRAGGYDDATAERFIARLLQKIDEARRLIGSGEDFQS